MKKIFKTLKFEAYKTIKNKFLFVAFSIFFILFLSVIIYSAYSFPLEKPEFANRAEIMESYERERDSAKLFLDYLNGEAVELPSGVLIAPGLDYQKEYDYYDFLIKTNTIANDYLTSNQQGFLKAHRGSYVMVEIMKMLGYIMPLFSIIMAFFVLTSENSGGTVKNLIATPIRRKHIFFGKVLFLCLVNLLVFLLAIAFPLFAGISDTTAKLILYGKNGFYVQSAFTFLFFPSAVAMLLSMLLYTVVSAALGQLFKTRAWGLIVPFLIYGVIQAVYAIVEWVEGVRIFMMPLAFMRYSAQDFIINAFETFTTGWLHLIITAALVAAFSVVCVILGGKKIEKKDF